MKQIIKKNDPEFTTEELELLNLIAELITEIIINETTKDNSIMIINDPKMEIKGVRIPCRPDHKRDCDNPV